MPSAIERKAGLGTSMTAESEIKHREPGEEDGLARGVHGHRDRITGSSFEPNSEARKR